MRIEIVTECVHGYVGQCNVAFAPCPGGSRRVLEPGDAERIIARALAAHRPDELETVGDCVEAAVAIVDALAGGEQP